MPTSVMPGRGPREVPAADPGAGLALVPPLLPGTSVQGMAILNNGLGTKADIERELDGIALAIRSFSLKQPDQIMRECAAYSARLTEIEVLLHRVESLDRQYRQVRTMQVDKFLQELDRQFKIASRLVEVMRQDLELMR